MKKKNYIFLIEVKSSSKEEYKKQLINGKLFCDWQLNLLKEHYDLNENLIENIIFIGLLAYSPREKKLREDNPRYRPIKYDRIRKKNSNFLMIKIPNQKIIDLSKIIKKKN